MPCSMSPYAIARYICRLFALCNRGTFQPSDPAKYPYFTPVHPPIPSSSTPVFTPFFALSSAQNTFAFVFSVKGSKSCNCSCENTLKITSNFVTFSIEFQVKMTLFRASVKPLKISLFHRFRFRTNPVTTRLHSSFCVSDSESILTEYKGQRLSNPHSYAVIRRFSASQTV